MGTTKAFAVLGGDMRFTHLTGALAKRLEAYRVYGLLMDKDAAMPDTVSRSCDIKSILPECDIIIFPLPMLDGKGFINAPNSDCHVTLEECLDYISPDAVVLGGMVSGESMGLARRHDIEIIDYLVREEFAVLNAIPTAEGAVQIALEELPTTLFGAKCLIIGYGRISKVLTRLLQAFGATIRVAARKYSDLAWVRANGLEAVHISRIGEAISEVDVVFNTVPSVLLDAGKLACIKKDCLVIDLASKPGGVDFNTAKQLGIKTIWALSLPLKVLC